MPQAGAHCSKLHCCPAGKLATLGAKDPSHEGEKGVQELSLFAVSDLTTVYRVSGVVNGCTLTFIIDTGAPVTLLRTDTWERVNITETKLGKWTGPSLVGVDGKAINVRGKAKVNVSFDGAEFPTQVVVADSLTTEGILGMDFMKEYSCNIDIGKDILTFKSGGKAVKLQQQSSSTTSGIQSVDVILAEPVRIPACSEIEVMARAEISRMEADSWLLEATTDRIPVMVAHAIVKPSEGVPVRLMNPRSESVSLQKGLRIASVSAIEEASIGGLHDASTTITKKPHTISQSKRDILRKVVQGSSEELTTTEREKLLQLLLEYEDIFAENSSDLGRTTKIYHQIHTEGAQPVRQQVRRISPTQRGEVKDLLQGMMSQDVIQPSSSPWASPVVLVKKKNGSIRFCIDYRKFNAVTRKDAYPLPRVDDTLDTLAGSKWFSTVDMLSGYWQVEVDDKDREKTAFCTYEGLYEFKVMPFGLCNAPATFQRLMDMILAGLQWSQCLVYLDDVIVVGRCFDEHLKNLRHVFDRFREAGLKLKPAKCVFCCKEVSFLGHIVSADGITTDPVKTEKVKSWPLPSSRREVQQFLGFASYYRRFIKDFAQIARPLHRLTEKTASFQWNKECQDSFDMLRNKLISAPILTFPNYSQQFILDTDASDTGIGGVLSQVQDGEERVIAYASRSLSKPERRYCVTRKELLAVVYFTKHFRPYLLGRHFLLRTDHGSLMWLQNFKEPEGQLARWLEKLQEFDFEIVHRRGRKHTNADALSRLPCIQCGRASHGQQSDEMAVGCIQHVQNSLRGRTVEEIRQISLQDPDLGPLLQSKEAGTKPEAAEFVGKSLEARRLFQLWDQLTVERGVLWRMFESSDGKDSHLQLVLPRLLREEVLKELHEGTMSCHLGEDKTLSRLKERFYWPGHWKDVQHWVRTCEACSTRKSAAPKRRAPLQTVKAGSPMQVVAVDILGPLPESDAGNNYILVAGDYFTRWVEAYPIPNQEAITVAKKLVDEMFCRFSPPEQLHSDQGQQFESQLIAEVCKILNIHKSRTTPYHPQSDGMVERFNRTLLGMLATTTKEHPFGWEDQIRKVCMAYNTSVHATTGYTPFYLMFGREARLPADLMFGTPSPADESPDVYARNLKKSLESAYERVRRTTASAHQQQKQLYDKKVHGKPFEVGDLVWLHSPAVAKGKSRKLHHPWQGPFRVIKKLSDITYRIQSTRRKHRRIVVHFDRLKPCHPGTRFENHTSTPSTNNNNESPSREETHFGSRLELIDGEDHTEAEPSQNSGGIEPEGTESEPEDPIQPNTDELVTRYPTRNRHPPDWYSTHITH